MIQYYIVCQTRCVQNTRKKRIPPDGNRVTYRGIVLLYFIIVLLLVIPIYVYGRHTRETGVHVCTRLPFAVTAATAVVVTIIIIIYRSLTQGDF